MTWIVRNLWLIPALPMLAAAISALLPQRMRSPAAGLAIGSISGSFLLSLLAFAQALHTPAAQVANFAWLQFGDQTLQLGWLLDPLAAVMLVMVTFVGLLIFIYSTGYMQHDENFTRFFCFLALFAGGMLGVVIANSLLLLFMCWEIVGFTSYLLIGFWYQNPRAAAAAKKAFITTRIGDLGLLIGMVWLYAQTHTLLFYDNGAGALEPSAFTHLATQTTIFGITMSSAIGLLIFCGAAGKSGQVPLHVWLPDAMEGPTPVSALIHAATMVAAGVFLMARVYPLISAAPGPAVTVTVRAGEVIGAVVTNPVSNPLALQVITWVGAITALFGATVAVAQWDIKRILAYSTVSQLGYMMIGIGVGGPPVGMFHLITHAFFKALLFLGAGSVIHGCSGEQDIRRMGGLRTYMPLTFATYGIGMLALSGFPLVVSGFWSKDAILHAAHNWSVSQAPFYMATLGAFLTAFYMTRQVCYVFFGSLRLPGHGPVSHAEPHSEDTQHHGAGHPHESPAVMTVPLAILALFAILLGFLGTPAWPWFQSFLEGRQSVIAEHEPGLLAIMVMSSAIALLGIFIGWLLYGRRPTASADARDVLDRAQPQTFRILHNAWYVDAIYAATFLRITRWLAAFASFADRFLFNGVVQILSLSVLGFAWLDNFVDTYIINLGFDSSWRSVSLSGRALSLLQGGRVQSYLRYIGLALVTLAVFLLWGAAR
jgi:NADH-quinone oxidoreductase subunit L